MSPRFNDAEPAAQSTTVVAVAASTASATQTAIASQSTQASDNTFQSSQLRDGQIIASVIIAVVFLAIIATAIRGCRHGWCAGGDEVAINRRKSSTKGMKELREDEEALRIAGSQTESVEMHELPARTEMEDKILKHSGIMRAELPGSLEVEKVVRFEGPLDSHPPSPVGLPSTPATSSWKAPSEWGGSGTNVTVPLQAACRLELGDMVEAFARSEARRALKSAEKTSEEKASGTEEIGIAR